MKTILIAADPGFKALPAQAMYAASHDPDIQQFREGGHKGILSRIFSISDDPGTHIGACSAIKAGNKILFFSEQNISHTTPVKPAGTSIIMFFTEEDSTDQVLALQ